MSRVLAIILGIAFLAGPGQAEFSAIEKKGLLSSFELERLFEGLKSGQGPTAVRNYTDVPMALAVIRPKATGALEVTWNAGVLSLAPGAPCVPPMLEIHANQPYSKARMVWQILKTGKPSVIRLIPELLMKSAPVNTLRFNLSARGIVAVSDAFRMSDMYSILPHIRPHWPPADLPFDGPATRNAVGSVLRGLLHCINTGKAWRVALRV